ncbi:DNA primase [Patescibacteria group bacterium]|nr:DNA primase [Patescibacteria group bacterium]
MDNVEEIKQKLDIISVIMEYVPLKKAGVNWKGCCPFHNEKTPSFMVNPDRQFWHCFGCNEGGDIFTFIQKMENIEFAEALKILAQKAGVQLERFDPRVSNIKNRLIDICDITSAYWQKCLHSDCGKNALEYVNNRKILPETLQTFKIGYAVDSWDDLSKFLSDRGFTETEIFQAGLTVKKENGRGYYDRFRDRLMFPIQNVHGNVVGFTGRTMKKDEAAKYVNTPESPIYHKGEILYALDKAKQAIRRQNYAIVVEGNMDAVTCHEAGSKNVVACSGTALSVDQINMIKRYTENIALCFDQDSAGQIAAERTIDLLFAAEMNIKVVKVIFGKDPDECIKKDPALWSASLKQAKLAMQFYFDRYLTDEALADINKKKKSAEKIMSEISKLKNKIEHEHWLKKLASKLDISENILREGIRKNNQLPAKTANQNKPLPPAKPEISSKEKLHGQRILTILFNFPQLIAYSQDYLNGEVFAEPEHRDIYKNLIILYNKFKDDLNKNVLIDELSKKELGLNQSYLNSLIIYIDKIYEGFDAETLRLELGALIKTFKINFLHRKMKEANQLLATAEKSNDRELEQTLLKQIQYFSEQLSDLK